MKKLIDQFISHYRRVVYFSSWTEVFIIWLMLNKVISTHLWLLFEHIYSSDLSLQSFFLSQTFSFGMHWFVDLQLKTIWLIKKLIIYKKSSLELTETDFHHSLGNLFRLNHHCNQLIDHIFWMTECSDHLYIF